MLFLNMLNQKSVSVSCFLILRIIGGKYMNFYSICQNLFVFDFRLSLLFDILSEEQYGKVVMSYYVVYIYDHLS